MDVSERVRLPPVPESPSLVGPSHPAVAPSVVEAKGAAARRRIWFVAPRGRNPSRLGALKAYFADMIEIDGDDSGGADLAKLLHQLGTVGLTRIAVTADGPLATDLAEQGLL